MGNSKLCATCTPINQAIKTKTKSEIGIYYKAKNQEAKGYGVEANHGTAFFGLLGFLILLLYSIRPKKKNVWDAKRYRNQTTIHVSRISDEDNFVGLFGQRFSQTEQKKLCSPPSKI